MFGVGMGEVVIILVLALILLGPKRLPDVAKQLGKGLNEFHKVTADLKSRFDAELRADEHETSLKRAGSPRAAGSHAMSPEAGRSPEGRVQPAPMEPDEGTIWRAADPTAPAADAQIEPGVDAALAEPVPAAAAPAPEPLADGRARASGR